MNQNKPICDSLDCHEIRTHLDSASDFFSFQLHACTGSTNLLARQAAAQGAAEGLVILAGMQTAGRGRLGRSFFSPGDTGIYMSLLLRPQLDPSQVTLVTTAAAVAVCHALEDVCDLQPQIKWVNDIFLAGRKVCGILTEAVFSSGSSSPDYLICGIGINVYPPENGFPEELSSIAGAVCTAPEPDLRNRLVAAILRHFSHYYHNLCNREFLPAYRRRSMVIGRDIDIIHGDDRIPAYVQGIDDDCRLLVRLEDGTEEAVSTGEISIRLKADV